MVIHDEEKQRNDVKNLKKLIEAHWNSELSSLALKNLKENQWTKPALLPKKSDVRHNYS